MAGNPDSLKAKVEGLRGTAIYQDGSFYVAKLDALIDYVLAGWEHAMAHSKNCDIGQDGPCVFPCDCGLSKRIAALEELGRRLGA